MGLEEFRLAGTGGIKHSIINIVRELCVSSPNPFRGLEMQIPISLASSTLLPLFENLRNPVPFA